MTKDSLRFYETIRDYFQIYLTKQKGMSEHTITSYRQTINQYLRFLVQKKQVKYENISFDDWISSNVNEYLTYVSTELVATAATRNQRLFALRAFLKYARLIYPDLGALSLEIQSIATAREPKTPVGYLCECQVEVYSFR